MTKFAKICAVLLFVPVVILTGYMVRLSGLAHFEKVEIAVEGYDPKDFFSGYYVALQPNWQRTDCSQFADNACPKKEFAEVYSFYVKEDTVKRICLFFGFEIVYNHLIIFSILRLIFFYCRCFLCCDCRFGKQMQC